MAKAYPALCNKKLLGIFLLAGPSEVNPSIKTALTTLSVLPKNTKMGFIKVPAQGKLTGCEGNSAQQVGLSSRKVFFLQKS